MMKNKLVYSMKVRLLTLVSLLFPFLALSIPPQATKEMMLEQLDTVKNIFEAKYAPHEWRQNTHGWDLSAELLAAKQKIIDQENPSTKDFQRILSGFLRSTKDHHVRVLFYGTESAKLPFSICGVDGRYFITYIDQDLMPSDIYPIEVGDELLELDGREVYKIIKDLKRKQFLSDTATDTATAEHLLVSREARHGEEVPHGPAMITVQSRDTRRISVYQIFWDYFPEFVKGPRPVAALTDNDEGLMANPWYGLDEPYQTVLRAEPREIGSKQSFLPPLGDIIWESEDSPFQAYIAVDSTGHRIGFIRIPSYDADEEEAAAFAEIIARFEKETDLLVIDQLNNSGGIDLYAYALLSMLTDRPLKTPRHRVSLAQDNLLTAYSTLASLQVRNTEEVQNLLGKTICGYPISSQFIEFTLAYQRFIVDQWGKGKLLTDPTYLRGVDRINPHPTARYRKPIVVLVNSLCFSAADLFPAILQDNHRAILFGETTAGAGGGVRRVQFPNRLGIKWISYTSTIAERSGSRPIEGAGVAPDVLHVLTQRDLQYNYIDYMRALHRTIDIMLSFQK